MNDQAIALLEKLAAKLGWPAGLIMGAVLGILVIVIFFGFPTTVAAFVNPEYWALDRVLSAIKSK